MMRKLVPKLRFDGFSGEWEEKKLIEISDFINEKIQLEKIGLDNYVSTENLLPEFKGATKATKLPNINNVTYFKKDDILLSNIRPYLKKVWFSNINGGASNDVIVIRAKKDVKSTFLLNIIQNDKFIDYVMLGAKGVKMPRGDISLIKKYPLFIPKPPEQQKIANCLSSLDALIEAQNKKIEALKKHKKGLMQGLFPKEGEKVPELRFDGFFGEWEEKSLIQLAKFRRGSFPQPYGLSEWYDDENGTPFIQVYDVNYNLKLKPITKRKISSLGAKKSVFIPKGTLIVTIQGSIGRVAITQYDAYIDRTLLLFEKFYQETDKLFFAYVIENLFEIEKEKAPGGIIKTITKEVLGSFIVRLPSFKEQEKIANCLSSLDALIEAQNKKVEALKKHKKGLMQGLFVGEEK